MAPILPSDLHLDGDSLNSALEAALALGRLGEAVGRGPEVVANAMLVRHTSAVMGGGGAASQAVIADGTDDRGSNAAARFCAALQESADRGGQVARARGVAPGSLGETVQQALAAAGFEDRVVSGAPAQVDALWASRPRPHGVVAAALAAGAIATSGAPSADAERGAALVGAVVLAATGCIGGPWIAPPHLDASSRSAAVQVDRSGAWAEWVRSWCAQLARECTRAEAAIAATIARFTEERADVRDQPRVGATDAAVLTWMQGRTRFTIRDASAALHLTTPTVGSSVARLDERGLAVEVTGRQRDRVWVAGAVLDLATGS